MGTKSRLKLNKENLKDAIDLFTSDAIDWYYHIDEKERSQYKDVFHFLKDRLDTVSELELDEDFD